MVFIPGSENVHIAKWQNTKKIYVMMSLNCGVRKRGCRGPVTHFLFVQLDCSLNQTHVRGAIHDIKQSLVHSFQTCPLKPVYLTDVSFLQDHTSAVSWDWP